MVDWQGFIVTKGNYKDRWYLKHPLTGEVLNTTVMLIDGNLVYGISSVRQRLYKEILPKAIELGGKGLRTRDFIDAFTIRGPSYGDVVREVMQGLQAQGRIRRRNVRTKLRPRYVYDVVPLHRTKRTRPQTPSPQLPSKPPLQIGTLLILGAYLVLVIGFPIAFFIAFFDLVSEGNYAGAVICFLFLLFMIWLLLISWRKIFGAFFGTSKKRSL